MRKLGRLKVGRAKEEELELQRVDVGIAEDRPRQPTALRKARAEAQGKVASQHTR